MKTLLFSFAVAFLASCNSTQTTVNTSTPTDSTTLAKQYAATIDAEDLKEHLYIYAGDEMRGRMTGSDGQ
ncbi:MAG: peptidase, partial [Flavobacteriaceae bacterium]|nr:peptidase [Flavobacteriaceae bacterium]